MAERVQARQKESSEGVSTRFRFITHDPDYCLRDDGTSFPLSGRSIDEVLTFPPDFAIAMKIYDTVDQALAGGGDGKPVANPRFNERMVFLNGRVYGVDDLEDIWESLKDHGNPSKDDIKRFLKERKQDAVDKVIVSSAKTLHPFRAQDEVFETTAISTDPDHFKHSAAFDERQRIKNDDLRWWQD